MNLCSELVTQAAVEFDQFKTILQETEWLKLQTPVVLRMSDND